MSPGQGQKLDWQVEKLGGEYKLGPEDPSRLKTNKTKFLGLGRACVGAMVLRDRGMG